MQKITVTLDDGSGWIFTKATPNALWYRQDMRQGGDIVGHPGIVPVDGMRALLTGALQYNATIISRRD